MSLDDKDIEGARKPWQVDRDVDVLWSEYLEAQAAANRAMEAYAEAFTRRANLPFVKR